MIWTNAFHQQSETVSLTTKAYEQYITRNSKLPGLVHIDWYLPDRAWTKTRTAPFWVVLSGHVPRHKPLPWEAQFSFFFNFFLTLCLGQKSILMCHNSSGATRRTTPHLPLGACLSLIMGRYLVRLLLLLLLVLHHPPQNWQWHKLQAIWQ